MHDANLHNAAQQITNQMFINAQTLAKTTEPKGHARSPHERVRVCGTFPRLHRPQTNPYQYHFAFCKHASLACPHKLCGKQLNQNANCQGRSRAKQSWEKSETKNTKCILGTNELAVSVSV